MTSNDARAADRHPIEQARHKTGQVREELQLAGAELEFTNTVFERHLAAQHKDGDVRKALDQNETVADDLAHAQEELAEVEALLEQEIVERERLERELARRPLR